MKDLPQTELLFKESADRILVLDGAMGTMFRTQDLRPEDFRKGPFADAAKDLSSVKDILHMQGIRGRHDVHGIHFLGRAHPRRTQVAGEAGERKR